MARVWEEREKSEAKRCQMYDGRGKMYYYCKENNTIMAQYNPMQVRL